MSLPDAALALVTAAVPGVPVYDGRVVKADRYVVLWSDAGLLSAQDVAQTSDLITYRFRLTYVSGGAQVGRRTCAWLADRCRFALVDIVPIVDGWQFGPIALESTQPIQLDPDEPTDVMYGSDGFVVSGARA